MNLGQVGRVRMGISGVLQPDLFPEATVTPHATRAMEAMRLGNFRDAVKLFKQLLKQESRPEWSEGLAQAYAARASQLAAKGMFEEAQILLDNTAAPDGTVRDPLLYVQCLIKRGQHQKAAEHALKYVGTSKAPASQVSRLGEVTAALSLAASIRWDGTTDQQSERGRWFEQASAAQQALAAWLEGKPHEEIDRLLARISLRSDFKALRLILKALISAAGDPDRARQLMDAIPEQSAFASLRLAVEAALAAPAGEFLQGGIQSSRVRSFVLQVNGVADREFQSLTELLKAESDGPGSLFSLLLKQAETRSAADVRNACLNLLPRVPDRLSRFEKTFGPLSEFDKSRVLAMAAEARPDWSAAGRHWRVAAQCLENSHTQRAKLSVGVIYRHLAELADRHQEIGGNEDGPAVAYLERSRSFDPDHLPTVLRLIAHYRATDEVEDLNRLLKEALELFPREAAVLLQALDWAAARKDLNRAMDLAHQLLALDPINPLARRRVIDLRISRAHELMRSKRADQACKELAEACKVELPHAPSFALRINQGLVGLQVGEGQEAEARLREGVDLAGGGVCGWFRAALEDVLMHGRGDGSLLRRELADAQKTPPTKEAILSIASATDGERTRENMGSVVRLVSRIRGWLTKGISLDWSVAEFQPVAKMFRQVKDYRLLANYSKRALDRRPGETMWRLYQLVARTKGDCDKLSEPEARELVAIAEHASARDRFRDAKLIWDFLESDENFEQVEDGDGDWDFEERINDLMEASVRDLSPERIRRIVAKHGEVEAIAIITKKLQKSVLGVVLRDEGARKLAKEMVDNVVASSGRRHSREFPW